MAHRPPLHRAVLPQAASLALMWRKDPGSPPSESELDWSLHCTDLCRIAEQRLEQIEGLGGAAIVTGGYGPAASKGAGAPVHADGKPSRVDVPFDLGVVSRMGLASVRSLAAACRDRKAMLPGSVTFAWINPQYVRENWPGSH